jgi:predicted ATPase with chaperone activity
LGEEEQDENREVEIGTDMHGEKSACHLAATTASARWFGARRFILLINTNPAPCLNLSRPSRRGKHDVKERQMKTH